MDAGSSVEGPASFSGEDTMAVMRMCLKEDQPLKIKSQCLRKLSIICYFSVKQALFIANVKRKIWLIQTPVINLRAENHHIITLERLTSL